MKALWVSSCRRRFAGFAVLLFILAVLGIVGGSCTGPREATTRAATQPVAPGSWEAKERQTVVILVGIDGFGWDFMERAETPALDRLAASGVRA